jgi:hypothetical protein
MSTPANPTTPLMVTWSNEKEKQKILNDLALYNSEEGVFRRKSTASRNSSYKDVDTSTNVRPTFTRDNYDYFRPEEATPKKIREIITLCGEASAKVGLVKNVIDLMGDFASQGIRIVHKDARAQKVSTAWAKKVKLPNRCERFLNILYRLGTVGILRQTAIVNNIDIKNIQNMMNPDSIEVSKDRPSSEIPIGYTYLHPNTLEVLGGDLSIFGSAKPQYGLNIPDNIRKKILAGAPKDREIINGLPEEILSAAKSNTALPLGDNFSIFFYKKDDWEQFPKPMIYSIIDDLMMLEKLKLADLAACDGAISSVRLWTLGDLANRILPTPAQIAKLSDILTNNVGGGCYDLVWDATLTFKESSSDISKFLGEEKYAPTLHRLYEGLGVPPTLTAAGSSGGFTNNYISLKTLTERLEYGRSVLLEFLTQELAILQKALGLKEPFQVVFNRMTLADEAAEKQLLIQLLDRNVISDETVLDRFGEKSDIERAKVKDETELRDKKEMPKKAGQFYSPQRDDEFKKGFIQTGQVTPSQLGFDFPAKKASEKTPLDVKQATPLAGIKGRSGQGRPKGKKDSGKRKQKTVKVRTSASFVDISMWAKDAQTKVSATLMPFVLKMHNKATARALTDKELTIAENLKFHVLSQVQPYETITQELILSKMEGSANTEMVAVYNSLVAGYIARNSKEPTIEEIRQLQIYAYSLYNQEVDNGEG